MVYLKFVLSPFYESIKPLEAMGYNVFLMGKRVLLLSQLITYYTVGG